MRRPVQAGIGLLALAVLAVVMWPVAASLFDRPGSVSARTVDPVSINVNTPNGNTPSGEPTDRPAVASEVAPAENIPGAAPAETAAAESAAVAAPADVAAPAAVALSAAPAAAAPAVRTAPRRLAQMPELASTTPAEGGMMCTASPVSISFALTDAMREGGILNPAVVWLTIDGVDVSAEVRGTRDFPQSSAELVYTPVPPLAPGYHEAWVNFPDEAGEMVTYAWTFEASDAACAPVAAPQPQEPPVEAPPAAPPAQPAPPPAAPPAAQPAPPAQAGPPPPPVSGTELLHFRAEQTAPGQQGQSQTTNLEFWFDPTSYATRLNVRDSQGEIATVCSGRESTTFYTSQRRADTQIIAPPGATGPILCPTASDILEHKIAMDIGAVVPAGEESLEGVAAFRIESNAQDGSGRVVLLLEKSHGLLLRETVYRSESGEMREVGTTRVRYSTIERISRSSAPADTFSTTVAQDWVHRKTRLLSEAEAKAFSDLQLYWVGLDFAGMGLTSINHEELNGPPGRLNTVTVGYAQPPDPNQAPNPNQPPKQLSIFQAPPAPSQGQQGGPGPGGPGGPQASGPGGSQAGPGGQQPPQPRRENVTVGSRQATLISVDQGPTIIEITMGSTFIAITGPDRGTVMQAAQALQRIQ
jgi:hypothetical protein